MPIDDGFIYSVAIFLKVSVRVTWKSKDPSVTE